MPHSVFVATLTRKVRDCPGRCVEDMGSKGRTAVWHDNTGDRAVVENGLLPINRRILATMSSMDLNRTPVTLSMAVPSRFESIERSARRHAASNKIAPDDHIAIDRSPSPGVLREEGRHLPARRIAGHRRSDDRVTTIKHPCFAARVL